MKYSLYPLYIGLGQWKKNTYYHLTRFIFSVFKIDIPPFPTVSAIIVKKDKILAVKISDNKYTLPGGIIKGPESIEEGLKREVYEETGLRIYGLKLQGEYVYKVIYPTINFTYFAKTRDRKLKDSPEGKPVWINPKYIKDKLIYSDNKEAVRKYLEKKLN